METSSQSETTIIDMRYIRGIPAIFKGAQCVLSLLAYILAEVGGVCAAWFTTFGYFKTVSMCAFTTTLILWAILLLKVPQRCLKCDCVNYPFVEFVYYCAVIVLYFFADLFMALHACNTTQEAACAFGFFAMFVYIVDTVMSFRIYWSNRKQLSSQSSGTNNPGIPSDVDPKY